jgi:hypothetical protein
LFTRNLSHHDIHIKIGLNLEVDVVECENIIMNYGERQGMGIKDKADKTKVIWTENIIIRLRLDWGNETWRKGDGTTL